MEQQDSMRPPGLHIPRVLKTRKRYDCRSHRVVLPTDEMRLRERTGPHGVGVGNPKISKHTTVDLARFRLYRHTRELHPTFEKPTERNRHAGQRPQPGVR